MTPGDDILDLLGRYATGSLTEEERKRLFAAAIDDQQLFEQLLQEQDVKQLLEEPGARDRMIHALQPPPRRKTAWIFGIAATAALSVVLMIVLMRPAPKPPQIAENKVAAPATTVQTETPPAPVAETKSPPPVQGDSATPPVAEPKAKTLEARREEPAGQPSADKPQKDALKKEAEQERDAVALASPAPAAPPPPVVAPRPAPQRAAASSQTVEVQAASSQVQQNQVASGPKQVGGIGGSVVGRLIAPKAAADEKAPAFGFHYTTDIQGHLSIIPAADGFLFATSNDGKILFAPKLSAAGIIVDLPIADGVTSVTVTFSETADPVQTKPALRTDVSGNVAGGKALAVEIRVK